MPDWVERVAAQFSVRRSRLYLVSDPDGLLAADRLKAAFLARGLAIVPYDDPVTFRYRFEAELLPALERPGDTGLVVSAGPLPEDSIPYDLLTAGVYVELSLRVLFPKLSAAALADLPRNDLDRLAAAYARYSGDELGERGTRDFLLERVYGVSPPVTAQREAFLAYLIQRHYARERLPASLDRLLASRLPADIELGADPFVLLREPERFFAWMQTQWDRFVAAGGQAIHESAVPFHAGPIRAYLDNLFTEGQLERVRVPAGTVPSWMRAGVRLPGDEPERDFGEALRAVDGAWPTGSAPHQDWLRFAWRWAGARALVSRLPNHPAAALADLRAVQSRLQEAFRAWLLARYALLPTSAVTTTPVMVHHVAAVLHLGMERGERVALVVVDGLGLDQWLTIREHALPDEAVTAEAACFAWVPTLTSFSRQAIFAGRPPYYFPESIETTDREEVHWRRLGADWGLPVGAVAFHKLPVATAEQDQEVLATLADARLRLVALVLNDVDQLTHRASLGPATLQRDVRAWAARGRLHRLLTALLTQGFTAYLTADHGSVEAVGAGTVREGVLVEQRALRARVYADARFLEQVLADTPHAEAWPPTFLPTGVHVAVAKGHTAFAPSGEEVVAHGGIALEEVVVPFVRIGGAT